MNYLSLKNKLLAVFIFLLCTNFSSAEIVKKIIVEGNERVNIETIKIFGKVNAFFSLRNFIDSFFFFVNVSLVHGK